MARKRLPSPHHRRALVAGLLALLVTGCAGIGGDERDRRGGLMAGSGVSTEISDGPVCVFGSVGTTDPIGAAVAIPGGDEYWIFASASTYPGGLDGAWILPGDATQLPGRLTASVAQIHLDTWAESQDISNPTRLFLESIPDQPITGTRSVYKVQRANLTGNPEAFLGYLEIQVAGSVDRHTLYSKSGDELPFETPVHLERFNGEIPEGLRQEHLSYKKGTWRPTGGIGWAPGLLPMNPAPLSIE